MVQSSDLFNIANNIQEVDTAIFGLLQADDILFFSHICTRAKGIRIRENMPLFLRKSGGDIGLRKVEDRV